MYIQLFDQRAIEALYEVQNAGFASWFVGGCVRDALLGRRFSDYDIATVAKPDELVSVFKNKYQIELNGIAFGGIRVNNDGLWAAITTLREDVNPSGRHTKVVFTNNLAKDANRRDFTINALYWDGYPDSPIIDFFHGQEDLRDQVVRFIGRADTRVPEDYLRILRFFRFSAAYAASLDEAALKSCAKHQQGLQYLSGNRVWSEWSKTLFQPNTEMSLNAMYVTGIDVTLFGGELDIDILHHYKGNDALLLTKLLLPNVHLQHLSHRLDLNNSQKEWLEAAEALTFDNDFREYYVQYGEKAKELVYYWAAKYDLSAGTELSKPFWQVLKPTFPITGKDLLNLHCPAGSVIGSCLKSIRNWWIQNNFVPTRKECLQYAESILKQ